MMPDLGAYTVYVLGAYAISLALLAGIVVLSLAQARRARDQLDEVEARRRKRDG